MRLNINKLQLIEKQRTEEKKRKKGEQTAEKVEGKR